MKTFLHECSCITERVREDIRCEALPRMISVFPNIPELQMKTYINTILKMQLKIQAVSEFQTVQLAQPIRLLLNYVGEEFKDVKFELGDGPDFSKEEWESKKDTYGLQFPNLPFYINGNIKITQTLAIIMFLGRKYNLVGKTEAEHIMVDMMLNFYMDMAIAVGMTAYNPNYENMKAELFSTLKNKHLSQLEKHLKDGNSWMVGDNITVADFPMYETLDIIRSLNSELLRDLPKIRDFMSRVEALPAIRKYMDSDNFLNAPLFNKIAGYYKTNK